MAEAVRAIVPAPRETWDEHAWATYLAAEMRVPVAVVFTRSRKTPVAMRPLREPRGALEVRLHGLFCDAPVDVRAALASWLRSGRRAPRATDRLDAYIAELLRLVPPTAARRLVATRGQHHDLERIAQDLFEGELAADFAPETLRPTLGWGRRTPSRTRHSLRLGSFDTDGRIVRIHPVLDQPAVPEWFVRFVVFHELLHAVFPIHRGEGRRWIHHGPAFRRRERAYVDHARAHAWERAHLTRLIRAARTGEPLVPVFDESSARTATPVANAPTASHATRGPTPRGSTPSAPAQQVGDDTRAGTPKVGVPAPRESGVLRALQRMLFPES